MAAIPTNWGSVKDGDKHRGWYLAESEKRWVSKYSSRQAALKAAKEAYMESQSVVWAANEWNCRPRISA